MRDRGRRNLMVNRTEKKEGMTKNKMKQVITMVLGEIDPAPLWRKI